MRENVKYEYQNLLMLMGFNPHQMIIMPCKQLQLVSLNSVSTENQKNYVRKLW